VRAFLGFLIGATGLLCATAASGAPAELIVCGWDEVFLLDVSKDPSKVWSWKAKGSAELPEEMWPKFRTTDECKPVDGGRNILITSSSDGVALVEQSSRKVLFHASVVNAHSAAILPGGRIAVAASHRPNAPGDRLVVFDAARSGVELFHTELFSGHGLVWDEERQLLWALGGKHLRSYRLADWSSPSPSLLKEGEHELPDPGGHDLSPVPGSAMLAVTTLRRAWVFDRRTHQFAPHPELAKLGDVKSIDVHPATGQIAYSKADGGGWWTSTIRFRNPDRVVKLEGDRVYKVRWNVDPNKAQQ
jgi:hypothetical protein